MRVRQPNKPSSPVDGRPRREMLAKAFPVLCVALSAAGVLWGTASLEAYVRALPEYQSRPEIALADVPEGLEERIMALIEPLTDCPWTSRGLCRRISTTLASSAWVERVRQVRRYANARVVVSCEYRMPAALIQVAGGFYVVGADRVRLPGRYRYDPSLVLVQGVGGEPPEPGEVWPGGDLRGAAALIKLLHHEPFFDQISGILVDNYRGRRDRQEPHVLLATAPSGGRIVWGSAPGEEIEENTVEEKLALLRENFRRWGRIDAGRRYIDISVFRDRFTIRDSGIGG